MEKILLKVGEIFLRKQNRSFFENALLNNIKHKILKLGDFYVKSCGSVLEISCKNELDNNLDILMPHMHEIFGISLYMKAIVVKKEIESIKKVAIEILKNINTSNFKIETKRSDKNFFMKSPQISSEIGGFIVDNLQIKAEMKDPEIILNIEIRKEAAYLYTTTHPGAGGLPAGTSGRGLVLFSGGIDSPVASYMILKRGLDLICVHFASPPYTSELAKIKVQKLIEKLKKFNKNIILYVVNLTKIQEEIHKKCKHELFTIISRRIMNKISEKIAQKERCYCLISGESLGQVASQTVRAIFCTNENINMPIFRPLIGMDKSEIVKIAKNIGTFDISIEPYDDCCSIFSPKHPRTKPLLKFVKIDENKLENLTDMIDISVENAHIFY